MILPFLLVERWQDLPNLYLSASPSPASGDAHNSITNYLLYRLSLKIVVELLIRSKKKCWALQKRFVISWQWALQASRNITDMIYHRSLSLLMIQLFCMAVGIRSWSKKDVRRSASSLLIFLSYFSFWSITIRISICQFLTFAFSHCP